MTTASSAPDSNPGEQPESHATYVLPVMISVCAAACVFLGHGRLLVQLLAWLGTVAGLVLTAVTLSREQRATPGQLRFRKAAGWSFLACVLCVIVAALPLGYAIAQY
ncbi:hypothetical protein ACGUFB_06535 [Actinotignum schaalii]|uniref:hypothetical protein n=1 Tax=Actinotignum schaalii TaxID=59505 RepID=UPI00373E587F